jgi:hypothetical protein
MDTVSTTIDFAERVEIDFTCSNDHVFTYTFSAAITAPQSWDCPRCGKTGARSTPEVDKALGQTTKSHWNMVLERRSLPDLEKMMCEQLGALRGH